MIINGNLILSKSNIESLGDLEKVGNLNLHDCKELTSLGNLKEVKVINFSYTPKLKSIPDNLKIKEIYAFDKDFNFLKNWKGFNNLKTIEVYDFDFLNIPDWITKDNLNKISFSTVSELKENLSKIKFSDKIINENNFNFFKKCFHKVLTNSNVRVITFNYTDVGFDILWIEKWNSSTYSHEYNKVKIELSYNIFNGTGDFTIDGSDLMGSESNLEEDEDLEDLSFIYRVPKVKINSLDDILEITSSGQIINIGEKMGIRYDY